MTEEEIIETLKSHYPREIRKQLIKTLLQQEKNDEKEKIEQQYKIINQIFSYVLKESNWEMGKNSKNWDNKPLTIMYKVFPQIDTTKWYEAQNISASHKIDIMMKDSENS